MFLFFVLIERFVGCQSRDGETKRASQTAGHRCRSQDLGVPEGQGGQGRSLRGRTRAQASREGERGGTIARTTGASARLASRKGRSARQARTRAQRARVAREGATGGAQEEADRGGDAIGARVANRQQGALLGCGGGTRSIRISEGAQDTARAGPEREARGGEAAPQGQGLHGEFADADQRERARQDPGEEAILRGGLQAGRGGPCQTCQVRRDQAQEARRTQVSLIIHQ